ncbi:hypothetical protein C8F04DRAFT_1277648 [Mycena alexandri]|uniref:Uncharacterized protein n=1 Tax=Mycena alexandri TaxID=1745969 RepID=A0AAD6S3Y9_9AGAR|nr:hypothetical protein C8F04DRAFT_1277648 [Mycena alexandri]
MPWALQQGARAFPAAINGPSEALGDQCYLYRRSSDVLGPQAVCDTAALMLHRLIAVHDTTFCDALTAMYRAALLMLPLCPPPSLHLSLVIAASSSLRPASTLTTTPHPVPLSCRPSIGNPTKSITLNKTGAELRQDRARQKERIAVLSFTQREALLGSGEHDIEMPDGLDFHSSDWRDLDSNDEEALQTLPPGEEGYLHSHAGKEETFHQILDKCRPGRGDPRRRAQRVQLMINSWKEQLAYLTDAYLCLKKVGTLVCDAATTPGAWEIEVIGLDEYGSRSFIHGSDAKRTNETLLRHGYIDVPVLKESPSPSPSASSRFISKFTVCAPATAWLSTAYDAYLQIIGEVDAHAHAAMGCNAAWYIRNICASCMYKTKNEIPLKFSWLGCMDGNNSLKLVDATFLAGQTRPDNRASTSFRWLSPTQVDVFKDEVADAQKKARSKKAVPTSVPLESATAAEPASSSPTERSTSEAPRSAPSTTTSTSAPPTTAAPTEVPARNHEPAAANDNDGDVAWLNINELSGQESKELAKCLDTCVERFAGIFLTVCRHGHVVIMCNIMCDMIRSGELMKYLLAMVKWLLDHYGADIGLGYDIMCAFFKTLMRSSLGASVTAMRMQGVVPAFHGHAHNRACQIGWHPLYVEGVGLEDFEECERTFAKSNHLASTTRLSTPFHRQQQIDEHFKFHDVDKHTASGNFIYQNYRQSLEKIVSNAGQLSILEDSLGTTAADYEMYHRTEVAYFQGLKKEPDDIQQTVDYIAVLQKHADEISSSTQADKDFKNLDFDIIRNGYTQPKIAQVHTWYRTTHTRYLTVEEELCRFEEQHSIVVRWVVDSDEYTAGLIVATERKYRAALTEVEGLVVLRLLELTKLGMSGLAYNLRKKISKALKTRSEAIRRALTTYNEAAAMLNPPRECLTFAEVLQTTTITEFDILRDTRQDIRLQPWTQPARREAMVLHFGIKRVREEIRRLNVEVTRLLTFLIDEHVDYYRAIASNLLVNPVLAVELQRHWLHASRVSAAICKRIALTSRLVGFSGSIFPGQHIDRDPALSEGIPPPYWLATELGVTVMSVEYEEPTDPDIGARPAAQEEEDEELVIRGLDIEEDRLVDLIDHLSTFDDT